MGKTKIGWTDITWNPSTGCDKVSQGCKNCYANTIAKNLKAWGKVKYSNGFEFTMHGDKVMEEPLRMGKKPQRIFVNSMSDTFHEKVTESHIIKMFDVMNRTPHLQYQVLTKRPHLINGLTGSVNWSENIYMGTTVEDGSVVHRIDELRNTSAKMKFLSVEPLIGPLPKLNLEGIDWVIVGGESGGIKKIRPIQKEWVEDIRLQCAVSGTAFFFKQWGHKKFNPNQDDPTMKKEHTRYAKGGCQLNGKIYQEWPESLTPDKSVQ
ncbi:MAG: DUF5131 family protein [Flavobacteriales bacterium]